MKKRIVFLLCLIIALCLPIVTVCEDQETASGIPANYVVANNLVFRPYTTNGDQAANVVNFYNTYCDGNNRKYGSYIYSRGGYGSDFILYMSLNSSSVSSSIPLTLRWNP